MAFGLATPVDTRLVPLIDALREAGFIVPDEVRTLGHLAIAIRANAIDFKKRKGDDVDDDQGDDDQGLADDGEGPESLKDFGMLFSDGRAPGDDTMMVKTPGGRHRVTWAAWLRTSTARGAAPRLPSCRGCRG